MARCQGPHVLPCSNKLKDDKYRTPIPILHVATLTNFLLQCQVQLWGKA